MDLPTPKPTLAVLTLPSTIRQFIPWYFISQPFAIVKRYTQYAAALTEVCSFLFLLKTLFAPWKSIVDPYPRNAGIGQMFYVFALNQVSRLVGVVVRLGAIAFGLCLEVALLLFFLVYFSLWISFPVWILASYALLFA